MEFRPYRHAATLTVRQVDLSQIVDRELSVKKRILLNCGSSKGGFLFSSTE